MGLNFGVYETLKHMLLLHYGLRDERELSVPSRLACGAAAGTMGQTVAYPFDVARRRLQVGGLGRQGRWSWELQKKQCWKRVNDSSSSSSRKTLCCCGLPCLHNPALQDQPVQPGPVCNRVKDNVWSPVLVLGLSSPLSLLLRCACCCGVACAGVRLAGCA